MGKFAACDKYIEIEIRDNKCYFKGEPIQGAIVDGKIVLQFVKGKADNPIVQGIIVYNSPLSGKFDGYVRIKRAGISKPEGQVGST